MNTLNFLRTGYYALSYGNVDGRTAGGDWWSDASYSATGDRDLSTDPTGVYPQGYNYRGIGFAVRCVVREG